MELIDKIKKKLEESYGFFESDLERQYEDKLIEKLSDDDEMVRLQWSTYHQVVVEIKYNIRDILKLQELQYRLTEDTNPREVCIDLMMNMDDITSELSRLYEKIKGF